MRNRIAEFRKPLALSQQRVADLLGLSRVTVNKIETDKITPSLQVAQSLADILSCSIYDIFDLDGTQRYTCPAKKHKSRESMKKS